MSTWCGVCDEKVEDYPGRKFVASREMCSACVSSVSYHINRMHADPNHFKNREHRIKKQESRFAVMSTWTFTSWFKPKKQSTKKRRRRAA